jgi:hypothetical protein
VAEQSAASGLPRRALESLVEYRKTYVGPVGLVKGKYVKSYSVGYALTYKGRRLVDCLKGLEVVDPTYTARISKELIKLAVRCRLSTLMTPFAQIKLTPSGVSNTALLSVHFL